MIKYLLKEATIHEAHLVEDWISAASENRQYFNQFRTLWEESKKLSASSSVDENAAWLRFRTKIRNGSRSDSLVVDFTEKSGKRRRESYFSWVRVAAAVILVAGLAIFGKMFLHESDAQMLVAEAHREPVIQQLPDSSVVTLNKESKLHYPEKFSSGKRRVKLEGEAFFDVKPDRESPFTIEVEDVVVRVLGTSFNVKSKNGKIEVIVETGKVEVVRRGDKIILEAGEKTIISDQHTPLSSDTISDKLYNYYSSRKFICDNTPLWKLVESLNEAYDAKISIENPEITDLKITASFQDESLDKILDIIAKTFMIEVQKSNEKIYLK